MHANNFSSFLCYLSSRIACILGHSSGFPCPICLVPRLEQCELVGTWPLRTNIGSQELLIRANESTTLGARHGVLLEQSLRDIQVSTDFALSDLELKKCIQNIFHNIMPPYFSVYLAVGADPLHQIEQGVFGKHIWPWLREELSKKQAKVLDTR